jgi:hypothetical protein
LLEKGWGAPTLELGADADPFMLHLYAALAEKDEVEHFRRMDRFRR